MDKETTKGRRAPSPRVAFWLSLIYPGLGRVHAARVKRKEVVAFLLAIGILCLGAFWWFKSLPGLFLTWFLECTWMLAVAWDAKRCAQACPDPSTPWYLRWSIAIPVFFLDRFVMSCLFPAAPDNWAMEPVYHARYRFYSNALTACSLL